MGDSLHQPRRGRPSGRYGAAMLKRLANTNTLSDCTPIAVGHDAVAGGDVTQ